MYKRQSQETADIAGQLIFVNCAPAVFIWPLSFTVPNVLRAAGDVMYTMVVGVDVYKRQVRAFAEADHGGDEDAAALAAKIEEMFHQIACWKELKNTVTLEELTRILLYDTGYFDYCSGLPAGKRRISNLRLLVEKAGQFEQNSHSGLYGFISYIEAMKKNNISIGEAKVLGEGENVVRVMTVHKSKGLEFPIVILTGMGRMIRYRGAGTSTAVSYTHLIYVHMV